MHTSYLCILFLSHTHTHTHIHIYIYIYIYIYMNTSYLHTERESILVLIYIYVHAQIQTYTRTYIQIDRWQSIRITTFRRTTTLCAGTPIHYLHTLLTYIHTNWWVIQNMYIYIYIYTYSESPINYTHTHIYTHIYIYIYIYIHTHTYKLIGDTALEERLPDVLQLVRRASKALLHWPCPLRGRD